jgi:hypothetical protein
VINFSRNRPFWISSPTFYSWSNNTIHPRKHIGKLPPSTDLSPPPSYNGHLRLFWESYAWVTLACQFASVAHIFVKNSTTNYFSTMRQLLNAFWISSIQDTRPELTALPWIQPMATWHPLQSSVLPDKFMCEFTISLLDFKPRFEGLIEGLFENAPKLFWHCCRHRRATKDSVLDREDYQLQCDVCNKQYFWTHRSGIPPGNNTLNFEYNFVLRNYVFESR